MYGNKICVVTNYNDFNIVISSPMRRYLVKYSSLVYIYMFFNDEAIDNTSSR